MTTALSMFLCYRPHHDHYTLYVSMLQTTSCPIHSLRFYVTDHIMPNTLSTVLCYRPHHAQYTLYGSMLQTTSCPIHSLRFCTTDHAITHYTLRSYATNHIITLRIIYGNMLHTKSSPTKLSTVLSYITKLASPTFGRLRHNVWKRQDSISKQS